MCATYEGQQIKPKCTDGFKLTSMYTHAPMYVHRREIRPQTCVRQAPHEMPSKHIEFRRDETLLHTTVVLAC